MKKSLTDSKYYADNVLRIARILLLHGGGRGFAIALLIQSLDGSLWDFYRVKISIALAIRSLDSLLHGNLTQLLAE